MKTKRKVGVGFILLCVLVPVIPMAICINRSIDGDEQNGVLVTILGLWTMLWLYVVASSTLETKQVNNAATFSKTNKKIESVETIKADNKTVAKEKFDELISIMQKAESIENDYVYFVQEMGDLELYSYLDKKIPVLSELHVSANNVSNETDNELLSSFRDNTQLYVFELMSYFKNIQKYINTGDMKYYTKAENAIEYANNYKMTAINDAVYYMTDSGYSIDEVEKMFQK